MSGKSQLKGGISEPSSDILPNWRDMRNRFGYAMLGEIVIILLIRKRCIIKKGVYLL